MFRAVIWGEWCADLETCGLFCWPPEIHCTEVTLGVDAIRMCHDFGGVVVYRTSWLARRRELTIRVEAGAR